MRFTTAALAAVLSMGGVASGQVAAPPATGSAQQPAPAPAPGTTPGVTAPVPTPVPAPVVPPVPLGARVFTGKSGLIFNAVRPDRVVDFEMVMGYLQAALEKSTDVRVREQANGWRVFKATEPGPNGTILYVFVIDPAVPGADYGLGRILADAYPDRIQEIWKLYQGSVTGGGSLLNLTPVEGPPPGSPTPLTPIVVPGGRGISVPPADPVTPPAGPAAPPPAGRGDPPPAGRGSAATPP